MPDLFQFKKILITNRGEIAVRIMRTCSELGIATVAVFSEPDRSAMHVRMADEAYLIGGAASAESYLRIDRIIETAMACGADAVHPGYGFLSENASFSAACFAAGIRFIGPDSATIAAMGDKTAARSLMKKVGIPMPPGTIDPVEDVESGMSEAENIGYPVLIKAAAGGGGKGMRIVTDRSEFASSFSASRSEAGSAFGDDRVFIEKYIVRPRHIEFQILADQYGNVIHLFERECSIQRRHQKVIEEAPSSILDSALREEMGNAAVAAARACSYVGAGTIEFLLDADKNFYFMEMNTRLQVEHPVTEWITGIDIVAAQIRIAEGSPLPWSQDNIQMNGHSVECRVYAEDPSQQFMPGPGKLLRHRAPGGFGIRVDAGVEESDEISIHYDPMISKLISWGGTREEAIARMIRALNEYEIAGVPTTIPFCRLVMEHESFRSGQFSTHFVTDQYDPHDLSPGHDGEFILQALSRVAAAMIHQGKMRTAKPETEVAGNGQAASTIEKHALSPWRRIRPLRDS